MANNFVNISKTIYYKYTYYIIYKFKIINILIILIAMPMFFNFTNFATGYDHKRCINQS